MVPFSVNPTQISRDRHAAYTVVLLKADPDSAPKILPELRVACVSRRPSYASWRWTGLLRRYPKRK